MRIEVHTTHHITSQESLKAEVAAMAEHTLERFADHVTSLDIHLDDENSSKGGADDIRCTIEARIAGRSPLAVTDHAGSVEQAARGASSKMARALESAIGRQLAQQRTNPGTGHLSAPPQ